ncbi:glycogen debranching protein GlgX [Hydrogenophaga sp. BPS33]|uniref:glycogen debranching protein GlgX n=1 Tax=Hydrogenophaga sp. BPS33 TaxID=2651974 RepID=UPI00131FAEC0|nr:glycogen debranching protein GlgX [Hydrogenophaga sp. BPS33]QHE86639.1 glycogen debranching protein GlgX [Hydrogenophaga sp. BPS33]
MSQGPGTPLHAPSPPPRTRRPRARHHTVGDGRPWPLGATLDRDGVNFAVYSSAASCVEVCLYAEDGRTEVERIALPCATHDVWHGHVKGLRAGQRYGLRAHGPYEPPAGQRFNPVKLLLDPYAKRIDRSLRGDGTQFAYVLGHDEEDLAQDTSDNGATAVKAQVVRNSFDWGQDAPPAHRPEDTVFYELHVRGFTHGMPGVPPELQGTYAGLGSPAAIAHLQSLGVTSVELLPVQAFIDDMHLLEKGLSNHWGYNTVAFFAPEPRYGTADPVDEFKIMVKSLHAAGIEVILDVVYNHTGEGNHLGPTLSFKGLDNAAYYRLAEEPRFYTDFTGTGNTLDTSSPPALQLVLDSLRYWVTEMHVDGFRFDLASALGRDASGAFTHRSPFFGAIAQDPVLRKVKLIAEPWDLGPEGYQVGGFPQGWQEWNGRYRDAVRDYWRNADGSLGAFAAALCGGADMLAPRRRAPWSSVNLVTVHDGFTLHDLVSYNDKHNEANGEDNQDGESHNRSWNCGLEGPADGNLEVSTLRQRQMRNFLTTLFCSHGVPLLLAGDEFARTQGGNNNGYCQDNAISWVDWALAERHDEQLAFTRALAALRRELGVLRLRAWPHGAEDDLPCPSVQWHSVWGLPMTPEEWDDPQARCVAAWIESGVEAQAVLLLFNATPQDAVFTLPADESARDWTVRVDTRHATVATQGDAVASGGQITLVPHSMAVLTTAARDAT